LSVTDLDSERTLRNLEEAAQFLNRKSVGPDVAIVLGSGLGALTGRVVAPLTLSYSDIPHMPASTVVGHAGQLTFGLLGGLRVACLSGRAHLYEGNPPESVVFGVRLLGLLGVKFVIVTNAAGGIDRLLGPGDLMLIRDHLNLTGQSPLLGPNLAPLGPRFPDMSAAYSPELRLLAQKAALGRGMTLRDGVYAGVLGPSYETPAEVDMLERLGAAAVGMSTVLEVIALRHMGVPVLGISCITNRAAGRSPTPLSHEEVSQIAGLSEQKFCDLVEDVCKIVAAMQI
jgi:purine-nucleoside phosphorylase